MYMETVNELRAAEEQLAGEKAAVRTEVQHLLEKTRQDGQALLEQTKQEQRRLDRERQEQTKQEAARRREQTLKDAQAACDALRSSARLSRKRSHGSGLMGCTRQVNMPTRLPPRMSVYIWSPTTAI